MNWTHRFGLAALAAALVAAPLAQATPAYAAVGDLKINEVESNNGDPGDWVELKNTGSAPVDASGLILRDNDDTHTYAIPTGTTVAPGAYLLLDEKQFGFGLGSSDAARLYAADGTTLLDSYSWTSHAAQTYGRCADGTGAFVDTVKPTRGAANACPAAAKPSVVVNAVLAGKGNYGFHAANDTYGDMIEMGILDPTKVTRTALQNAASVASLMLTTECMVAEAPKDEAAPAGMPGGMGGMGGMGDMGM